MINKKTSLILSLLLLFASGVVSQAPDDAHEKCKDARDYVGCIQVLTGTTVSKEEAEIEEIKDLKKALALLPSRLENTSLRDLSMAIQPFTDALAAAEAAAIGGSDYSLEDKTKILKLTNPSLRLSFAIDVYRSTWRERIDLEVRHGAFKVHCSTFDNSIDRFNMIMGGNLINYDHIDLRALKDLALKDLDNDNNYGFECRTNTYLRNDSQMLHYILGASKEFIRTSKFPSYTYPYKPLRELKKQWLQDNKYDFSTFEELEAKNSNNWRRKGGGKKLTAQQNGKWTKRLIRLTQKKEPSMKNIGEIQKLLRDKQDAEFKWVRPSVYNYESFKAQLASFFFITKEGDRVSNLKSSEELAISVLAAGWGPHIMSIEYCASEVGFRENCLTLINNMKNLLENIKQEKQKTNKW